ncbi:hypothetical protein BRC68_15560 [Halobacteriales archaeon QH_6_64_20]|jgi:uncharacterized Zn finger protein (UPF0148 family)|nr:MAG: hypothetical protein BRC68_15560 [Halobacteriales archaeon QH_6_64_20]
MRIRGERECSDCGQRWSYYETGDVSCPNCGSLRSTGVGERERHTTAPVTLDLTAARDLAGEDRWEEAIEEATARCGEYVRRRGFLRGGELLAFDDTYLAAMELRAVAREYRRDRRAGENEEIYLLSLLRGADAGERPSVEAVPDIEAEPTETIRTARALAYAKAIEEYRREVSTYLDDHLDPAATKVSGSIAGHVKRVQALDGDIDLRTVETLVRATQDVGRAIREEDEEALATARDRLGRL